MAKNRTAEEQAEIERQTHITHCCVKHGCKYSDRHCPVAQGEVEQSGACEECGLCSEGYYGPKEPIDYQIYQSPGVLKTPTVLDKGTRGTRIRIHFMPDDGRLAYWTEYTDHLELTFLKKDLWRMTWRQGQALRTENIIRFQIIDEHTRLSDCGLALM